MLLEHLHLTARTFQLYINPPLFFSQCLISTSEKSNNPRPPIYYSAANPTAGRKKKIRPVSLTPLFLHGFRILFSYLSRSPTLLLSDSGMTEERDPKPAEDSPAASATAARQRKKRRWDQPAESVISAGLSVTGTLPLASGGIVGIPLPGSIPLPSSVITNPVPANSATASLLLQSSSLCQNSAAIVHKLIQPKIQDELIAREIVINDAEPTIRYQLTKRQTQEEIQRSTGAVVITRGKYRPPNALPDSEKPLYLHISAGAHLKDTAERIKAVDRAAFMVEEILKQVQSSQPATIPFNSTSNGQATQQLSTCLFLGFETDPSLNIAARIRGPNDQYINHIMNETGAIVIPRGRGSGNLENFSSEEAQQPLHLYLSSPNPKSLEAARILAENLLDTISAECGASRISSRKVYSAVPPPQQLLSGVQSSGEVLGVNANPVASLPCTAAGSMPLTPSLVPNGSPGTSPPGSVLHCGDVPNYGVPQPSYPYPSITGGTYYSGYGGIYPQATPLQQVALALRKAPPQVPLDLASTVCATTTTSLVSTASAASMSSKMTSSSIAVSEKRPLQRRKFQELPVTSKEHQNLLRGSECLKAGSKGSDMRNVSTMPPPKKLIHMESDGMRPPPPRAMPPPPLKFAVPKSPPSLPPKFVSPVLAPHIEKSYDPVVKKLIDEPASDTLLKLVEYGEEDDDVDSAGEEYLKSNLARKPS